MRAFARGRFELVSLAGLELGRATYRPGWRWSVDVGAASGRALCDVEHVGLVLSGRAAVWFPDGGEWVLAPGDLFHVAPGHDSWVLGEEPYVSLHFAGAADYAGQAAR